MVVRARPLESVDQVVYEVEAVGDLDRVGRALPRAVAVRAAAIPADDLHPRVRREPRREGGRLAVGQQVDHAPPLQVDEDGAVPLPAA